MTLKKDEKKAKIVQFQFIFSDDTLNPVEELFELCFPCLSKKVTGVLAGHKNH